MGKWIVIAGAELKAELSAEIEARVPVRFGYRESEALCAVQREQARRGILAAELVESVYGWSVRYASGVQNFGLLASSRRGQVDGSRADAEAWARRWVAQDPGRRYVSELVS